MIAPLAERCRKCSDGATWRIRSNLNGRTVDVCRVHADCLMHRVDKGDAAIVIAPRGYTPCAAGCFRWIGNLGRAAHQCNASKVPAGHDDRCLEFAAAAAYRNHMVDQPYGREAFAAGRDLIDADLTDCHCKGA
jgi:hypothetical protein